jgi:hypothetical protein
MVTRSLPLSETEESAQPPVPPVVEHDVASLLLHDKRTRSPTSTRESSTLKDTLGFWW